MLRLLGGRLIRLSNISPNSSPIAVLWPKYYCSGLGDNTSTAVDVEDGSKAEIIDIGTLMNYAEKKNLTANVACDIVTTLARLKKESKVIESEYLQDERFLQVMKQLESNHTNKMEPLALISSLKVGERTTAHVFIQ